MNTSAGGVKLRRPWTHGGKTITDVAFSWGFKLCISPVFRGNIRPCSVSILRRNARGSRHRDGVAHPCGTTAADLSSRLCRLTAPVKRMQIRDQVFNPRSSLIPGRTILVPGILAFGSLIYALNVASSQVIPEFLFASE